MDKSLNLRPEQGESTPRTVAALATDAADDTVIPPHAHRRGQLIHAISGVMIVSAALGSWVVPPGRGVWVPPGMAHQIRMAGDVQMRTVFVEPGTRVALGNECRVVDVGALLRQLIVAAVYRSVRLFCYGLDKSSGRQNCRAGERVYPLRH